MFIIYAPSHVFFFSLYLCAMLRCQKCEWSVATMEDGRWEDEGHGPVVVVGKIDSFQLLMLDHFFGASTTNTLYCVT